MLCAVSDTAVRRIVVEKDPFAGKDPNWSHRAWWPARWIGLDAETPFVAGYRLRFDVAERTTVRLHVSADERYRLFLDGEPVGRGPDRGDVDHWNFETYEAELTPGPHLLAAQVWSIGVEAPYAQHTHGHGFLLAASLLPSGGEGSGVRGPESLALAEAEDQGGSNVLNTGEAAWEAAILPGYGFLPKGVAWGCGLKLRSDGRALAWGWEHGRDALSWLPAPHHDRAYANVGANDMEPGRMLIPAILPAQWEHGFKGGRVRHVADHRGGDTHDVPIRAGDSIPDEVEAWQRLLGGEAVTIPPHTGRRVILDLEEYLCAYPELHLRGGRDARVRVHWQEALFGPDDRKGDRNEIEGKRFKSIWQKADGVGDLFIAGGGDEHHRTLWWEAGRYVEIVVETADEPLTLAGLAFVENRYPYEDASEFASSDPRLAQVKRLGFRTLQMCAHETTMDCPFYEQLQYVGDTRLQCLVAYVTGDDDRLARQALLAFDRSRDPDGLTRSRYPSRIRQTIPTFSLWWVAMVHDFALWRGDLAFVRGLMPGVRAVLDAYRRNVDAEGVYHALEGWNFTDWVPAWKDGTPAGGHWGVSGILNLHLALVARMAAELEEWMHEPELAARNRKLHGRVLAAAEARFWDAKRGLYADDLEHAHWSEHAQCLALLAGARHGEAAARVLAEASPSPEGEGRVGVSDASHPATPQNSALAQTTVYFSHYLFEAMGKIGRTDVVLDRMGLWYGLLDQGLKTVVEMPEPTRSDCHAWGAHPIFHLYATLLGVRPTSPGMATVTIRPQLGGLEWAEGTLRTAHGPLHVRADASGVKKVLPHGVRER